MLHVGGLKVVLPALMPQILKLNNIARVMSMINVPIVLVLDVPSVQTLASVNQRLPLETVRPCHLASVLVSPPVISALAKTTFVNGVRVLAA